MDKLNLTNFIRKDIAGMEEYVPVPSLWDLSKTFMERPNDVIKLDAGENQFGYSPAVDEVIKNSQQFNYYPDPEYKELRQAIAMYAETTVDNIIVGSGSDELLDLLFRLTLEQSDKVINCPPTFGMYSFYVTLNKGTIVSVPRNADFSLNIERITSVIDENVKAIVVCMPNNPTGTSSSKEEIISLLKTGKLVIVDEAYFEFSSQTVVPLINTYDNLIVLRTFSKWAGLAGLRLGYGVMSPFLVRQLFKIKPPYNVNLAACYAGIAALSDIQFSRDTIRKIISERKRMGKELQDVPFLRIYPSDSNLLFMNVRTDLQKLKDYMERKKIAIRYYDSDLTGAAIRISIGKPEQNTALIIALQTYEKT